MDHFDALCKVLEDMDPQTYNQLIHEKSVGIIQALTDITSDGIDGISIFTDFILCSISADGVLAEEEFILVKDAVEAFLGREITYEEAKVLFVQAGLDHPEEYKRSVDMMVDILGILSQELKDDIILVCLMICAVDGVVSDSEREWIAQLIE
ncbi:MAG: hypothetical protein ACI4QG_06765 [Candidatus Cryptobacteroides sp.]